jgi:hypothetical protein
MNIMQIHGFNTRQANGRNGPFTLYEIILNGQPYVARKPLYDQAVQLPAGSVVEADTRTEQNGQWTNYYVDDLRPQQQGFVPQQPSGPASSPSQYPVQAQPPAPPSPSEKDVTIWRQCATKVAAHLAGGGAGSFWENVDILMRYYETGEHPMPEQGDVATRYQQYDNPEDIPF